MKTLRDIYNSISSDDVKRDFINYGYFDDTQDDLFPIHVPEDTLEKISKNYIWKDGPTINEFAIKAMLKCYRDNNGKVSDLYNIYNVFSGYRDVVWYYLTWKEREDLFYHASKYYMNNMYAGKELFRPYDLYRYLQYPQEHLLKGFHFEGIEPEIILETLSSKQIEFMLKDDIHLWYPCYRDKYLYVLHEKLSLYKANDNLIDINRLAAKYICDSKENVMYLIDYIQDICYIKARWLVYIKHDLLHNQSLRKLIIQNSTNEKLIKFTYLCQCKSANILTNKMKEGAGEYLTLLHIGDNDFNSLLNMIYDKDEQIIFR